MAAVLLLLPTYASPSLTHSLLSPTPCNRRRVSCSSSDPPPIPSRRGRKKSTPSLTTTTTSKTKKQTKRNKKTSPPDYKSDKEEEELPDYDDEMDYYDEPPLICCFGAAQKEFVPTVRVAPEQMHPDIYSQWKMLQWNPPEFARAPGGPPSNVSISHVRLGGRAAFMGKVGFDELGKEMVTVMNKEGVQTRSVKFDYNMKTAISYMKLKWDKDDDDDDTGKLKAEMVKESAEDSGKLKAEMVKESAEDSGKLKAEMVKESAEDSMSISDLNIAVLKEARIFHFNSQVLTSPSIHDALYRAIAWSKKFSSLVFFDPNLPLPLWKSRDDTKLVIKKAWELSDIIELSRSELEFLLDEDYYERKRNYTPQYYAETIEQTKDIRNYYHYTREEISPLWHSGLKLLLVTDGTLRIHYYTPKFDGVVVGTEDVLITPFTCDRTGSGDAVVAGIMRKLTAEPEMLEDQDRMDRQLRFVIAAGIISQWTIGSVRGFPTESAAQNLKEQVYVPSMW